MVSEAVNSKRVDSRGTMDVQSHHQSSDGQALRSLGSGTIDDIRPLQFP